MKMLSRLCSVLFVLVAIAATASQPLERPGELARLRVKEAYGKLPLSFEANHGQTDSQVKFLSRGSGYNIYLTPSEAIFALEQARPAGSQERALSAVLRMRLIGANPAAKVTGGGELPGKSNYFIGNDPAKWRTDVPNFGKVSCEQIYPGIDLVYYGNQRKLETDFIVAPGAKAEAISIGFSGATKLSLEKDGSLAVRLAGGAVHFQKPVIYQLIEGVRREVAGSYTLKGELNVGFEVPAYERCEPLVIDPILVYSTYLGGNGVDEGYAIAVGDPSSANVANNAYVTGRTSSTDFPDANSAPAGFDDVFVARFNAAGSALVYSTYLGGSGNDFGFDIALDFAGNAYVTGKTTSADFPVMNAFQPAYSGGTDEDVFVTRINTTGSALVYSTYLAGTFGGRGWGIAASSTQGYAYVTGTTSIDFPVTAGAFEATNYNSGFLTKLCTNCSGAASLVYSTFLAHTGYAEGRAVAADVSGNAYVTGNLNSTTTNFATTGVAQATYGGGAADAYVEKFNTNLAGEDSRVYATYLGGSGKDIGGNDGAAGPGRAIVIDQTGAAYVTGSTVSTNFPTKNAAQNSIGGQSDAFLTKLNPTGTAYVYSTYLGGTGDDFGRSVAVNLVGDAYVTGVAGNEFPTRAPLPTPNASFAFVTKFVPDGSATVYSTTLSGVSYGSFGIALDGAGNAFVTGSSNGTIVTAFPFQPDNGGGGTDGFVTVISDPTIIGRVVDGNGNPVVAASVNLEGDVPASTTSDAQGYYTFGLLTPDNSYTVSVVREGYLFSSIDVSKLAKNVLAPVPVTARGVLGNISTRLQVLTGDDASIGGFIILGPDPARVIVRAIGPSLSAFGVPGVLADPILELHAGDGSIIATNDNWKSDHQAEIEATTLQPGDDLEAAIVATLPGDGASYTAVLRGTNGTTGVGLVEAYDLDTATANSQLANISTRGFVDTGDDILIGGFILGNGDSQVVVRAIGPSLTGQGVAGALEDPTLELHDGNGDILVSDDNWKDAQEADLQASGLAPSDDLESAILSTLPAGSYTAIVRGKDDMTGVGLIEVYNLN